MKTKWVKMIAASLGILLVSTGAQAEETYLKLNQAVADQVTSKEGSNRVAIRLSTGGEVPMDGQAGAFGYAALSDGGNNVLVLVTHLPIDDSSHEATDSGFHAHILDLKGPTPACIGATFEVDVENSRKNTAFDAAYPWSIEGANIEVRDIPVTDLGNPTLKGYAAFKLKPVMGNDGKPSHLCVTVVDQV